MAVNLFEMFDNLKNSQQVQGAGASIKNATGVSLGEKPYSTCPPGCFIAPEACGECKTYKEALKKVLEDVEDLEAYYSNFVVDPDAMPGGERECWYCGAPALGVSKECEYCGSDLGNGKSLIRVQSKNEIPDPVAKAINIIYERQKMAARYQKEKGSSGLLKGLLGMGGLATMKMAAFDNPMTVQEVKETAQSYGVSVVTYLSGLDTGTYMTKVGKANMAAIEKFNQQMEQQRERSAQQSAERNARFNALKEKSEQSKREIQQTLANIEISRAPKYLAGGGGDWHCCGNCRHYMAYNGSCGRDKYRNISGASDSCGFFSSK